MKKIICIVLMVICVVGVAMAQKYKTRAATKKEQKAFPAKEYITVKYDVGGLFTKQMTITLENNSPVFSYININLKISFYDVNGTPITSGVKQYKELLMPKKTAVFYANIDIPKTAQTAKVEVLSSDMVIMTEIEEPKTIRKEWE